MQVKSIAECSPWSILQYFWPALSKISLENQISVFCELPFNTGFTVNISSMVNDNLLL